ncbi:hypothetical protein C8Q73DRAFT_118244 [Cubamyces lactineus]|nr:hypothetical protein C8Q73DRAFT_118244 [Cubamyces lactineus]
MRRHTCSLSAFKFREQCPQDSDAAYIQSDVLTPNPRAASQWPRCAVDSYSTAVPQTAPASKAIPTDRTSSTHRRK